MGSGLGAINQMGPFIYSLTSDGMNNVYVGGTFGTAGGVATTNIAKWDGTNWSALGPGLRGARVRPLASDGDGNVYASAASNSVSKWDGNSWSSFGSSPIESLGGLYAEVIALEANDDGILYAGGSFSTAGGKPANNIAKWDGNSWSALSSGMNRDVHSLVLGPSGTLYSGGTFSSAGDVPVNGIAKWDGNLWSALGSGMNGLGVDVRALALNGAGDLYAAGRFSAAGGVPASNIAK